MRRSRIQKSNGKTLRYLVLLAVILVIVCGISLKKQKNEASENDFKVAMINDDGLGLVSISLDRKMINVMRVDKDVPVWLPNGFGWYRVNQVSKILIEQKKSELERNLFWYNFGFLANQTILNKSDNEWRNDWFLIRKWGLKNWFEYKINYSQMLFKEEEIKSSLIEGESVLDEIMPRDFADNKILNEEIRLSVFNATPESGLASFLGKRFEWSGFSVISTENTEEKVDNCLFIIGPKVEDTVSMNMLKKNFNCKIESNSSLNEGEVELYFGDKFVSVLKYSSYK